jgi:hypothetical protein
MRCWELFETRCPKIGHTILMDNGWVVGEVGNKTNFSLVIASLLCLRLLTDYSKFVFWTILIVIITVLISCSLDKHPPKWGCIALRLTDAGFIRTTRLFIVICLC